MPRKNSNEFRNHMISRARNLRRNQTGPETQLWFAIRNRQLANLKFRRQQTIGKYIVDFCCESEKLIIELDGNTHNETNAEADQRRQLWLESLGYRVFRFDNDEVLQDLDNVLTAILIACGLETQ